ncbi:hypothetical protein, partial [Gulosibacter bifidus]
PSGGGGGGTPSGGGGTPSGGGGGDTNGGGNNPSGGGSDKSSDDKKTTSNGPAGDKETYLSPAEVTAESAAWQDAAGYLNNANRLAQECNWDGLEAGIFFALQDPNNRLADLFTTLSMTGVNEFELAMEALVQTAIDFSQTDEGRASGFEGYDQLPTNYDYSGTMHRDDSAKADVDPVDWGLETPDLGDVIDAGRSKKDSDSDSSGSGSSSDGSSSTSGKGDDKGGKKSKKGKGGLIAEVAEELFDRLVK